MFLLILITLMLLSITNVNGFEASDVLAKLHQSDYKLKFERAILVNYNRSVFSHAEARTFKYNRTTACVNVTGTINANVDQKALAQVYVLVQAYKFMSNEYRPFPVHFQVDYCKAFASNAIGIQSIMKCGNITGCPLEKGKTYHVCNFSPEEANFPPLIPSGSYKVEFHLIYKDIVSAVVHGFGTIYRALD